jgi:gas vesicle protein
VLFESKSYDPALKALEGDWPAEFAALAADRRGDILLAQNKREEAKAAFQQAYKGIDERLEYRRVVEIKLNALGVDVSQEGQKAQAKATEVKPEAKPEAKSEAKPEAKPAAAAPAPAPAKAASQ